MFLIDWEDGLEGDEFTIAIIKPLKLGFDCWFFPTMIAWIKLKMSSWEKMKTKTTAMIVISLLRWQRWRHKFPPKFETFISAVRFQYFCVITFTFFLFIYLFEVTFLIILNLLLCSISNKILSLILTSLLVRLTKMIAKYSNIPLRVGKGNSWDGREELRL